MSSKKSNFNFILNTEYERDSEGKLRLFSDSRRKAIEAREAVKAKLQEEEEEERKRQEALRKAEEERKKNSGVMSFIRDIPKNTGKFISSLEESSQSYGAKKRQEFNQGGIGSLAGSLSQDATDFVAGTGQIWRENVTDTRNEAKLQDVENQESNELLNFAKSIEKEDPERAKKLIEIASKGSQVSDKLSSDLSKANKGVFGTNLGLGEAGQIAGTVALDVAQFVPLGALSKIKAPFRLGDDLTKNAPKWVNSIKTGIKYAAGFDEVAGVASSGVKGGVREMMKTSAVRGSLAGSTQGMVDSASAFDEDLTNAQKAKIVAQNVALNAVIGTMFDLGIGTIGAIGNKGQKILDDNESRKFIENFKNNNPSSLDVGNIAFDSKNVDSAIEAKMVINEFAKAEGKEVLGETIGLDKQAPELYRYAKESFIDPVIVKSQEGEPISIFEIKSSIDQMKKFLQSENVNTMSVSVIDPQTRSKLDDLKLKLVEGEEISQKDLLIHDGIKPQANRNGVDITVDELEGKKVRYTTSDGVEIKGSVKEDVLELDNGRTVKLDQSQKQTILDSFDIQGVNTEAEFQTIKSSEKGLVEDKLGENTQKSQTATPSIQSISSEDLQTMKEFSQYSILGKEGSDIGLEAKASKLAEKYNLPKEDNIRSLGNQFQSVIEADRQRKQDYKTIVKKRDEVGDSTGNRVFQVQDDGVDAIVKQMLGVPEGKTKSVYDNPKMKEVETKLSESASVLKKNRKTIKAKQAKITEVNTEIANHPAKALEKYTTKDGKLSDHANSTWSRRGDDVAEALGFENKQQAVEAFGEYTSLKNKKIDLEDDIEVANIRLENTSAKAQALDVERQRIIAEGDVGDVEPRPTVDPDPVTPVSSFFERKRQTETELKNEAPEYRKVKNMDIAEEEATNIVQNTPEYAQKVVDGEIVLEDGMLESMIKRKYAEDARAKGNYAEYADRMRKYSKDLSKGGEFIKGADDGQRFGVDKVFSQVQNDLRKKNSQKLTKANGEIKKALKVKVDKKNLNSILDRITC